MIEASYILGYGENAGKQAKNALQAKFRCYCVDFNGLFLVAYFDLYNDFSAYFKILCPQRKLLTSILNRFFSRFLCGKYENAY